jgi:hypothetical protein
MSSSAPARTLTQLAGQGARRTPAPRAHGPGDLAESGHGLRVVAELAASWGHQDLAPSGLPGRAVWFHLTWAKDRPDGS